jgi:hypothetical protein
VNLTPPDPNLPPNPCVASLSFLDDTGAVFLDKQGRPVSTLLSLDVGASGALELPWGVAFLGRSGSRQALRLSVEVTPGPPNAPDPCAGIVTTLELYEDITGRTAVMTNPGPPNANVEPGPPNANLAAFGLLGLARLQNARVSVVNLTPPDPDLPPSPCDVALAFVDDAGVTFRDGSGNPIALEASLEFGESAALELPSSIAFLGRSGLRRAFRASVEDAAAPRLPPSPCAGVVATVEIYESLTRRTTVVQQNPGPPTAPAQ